MTAGTVPDPPPWATVPGTWSRCDYLKQDDQIGFFENPEGRYVEEFTRRSRTRPTRNRDMKKQAGKDMIIFGSGSIVSQLTQHSLIDE